MNFEKNHECSALAAALVEALDPERREPWPSWAREHISSCAECQDLETGLRALHELGRASSRLARDLKRRGPPSMQSLQERARRRRPPLPDDLVEGTSPFTERQYRGERSSLELTRTQRGVRAWHPEAHHLLVFAAPQGLPALLLGQAWEERSGVGLDLIHPVERETLFVAMAARERLDPQHWALWLADARHANELQPPDSDLVHMALVHAPAPIRASNLHLREDPLPDAKPEVTALLKQASQAGRADDAERAASIYRRALVRAFTVEDETGVVKATAGLALALMGRGYLADAIKALRQLVEGHRLDAFWAGWACQNLAWCAYNLMDLRAAERWIAEAERVERPPSDWLRIVKAWTECAAGRYLPALDTLAAIDAQTLPEGSVFALRCHRCIALAGSGQVRRAQAELEGLAPPEAAPLEAALLTSLARCAVAEASEQDFDWAATLTTLRSAIATKDGDVLATWDAPPLLMLAERARQAGHVGPAKELFRLRFLNTHRTADPSAQLLALAATHDGLLLHSPGAGGSLRRLTLSREQFSRLAARAREELLAERSLDTCRALGAMLFTNGLVPQGELLVASDGLLTDAPLLAIAQTACGDSGSLPRVRDVVGLRRPPRPIAAPPLPAIASLADAQGDLPWASREVGRHEAAIWLRGTDARKGQLRLDRPVGLLHLGLHAQREHGIPQLLIADGPLSPMEVARHRLPGHPVVLLAGCATALACSHGGTGRSLADAFLRAGAAGVVATRWRVEDREIHSFVRALVQAWPFTDLAGTVRRVCLQLKRQGKPARVWAAPAVY